MDNACDPLSADDRNPIGREDSEMGMDQRRRQVPSDHIAGGWRNRSQRFLRQIVQGEAAMRVKYFSDTDTALVEFTDNEVMETKEISENIYIDLDKHGNLVSMTIEHARSNARLQEFSYQEIISQSRGEARTSQSS